MKSLIFSLLFLSSFNNLYSAARGSGTYTPRTISSPSESLYLPTTREEPGWATGSTNSYNNNFLVISTAIYRLEILGGNTNYILLQNSLQSGATAYVSSFSVNGQALFARSSGGVGVSSATLGPSVLFTVSTNTLVATSAGNVGIGAVAPTGLLQIGSSNSNPFMLVGSTGRVFISTNAASGRSLVAISTSLASTAVGEEGILHIQNNNDWATLSLRSGATNGRLHTLGSDDTGNLRILNNGTEAIRFTAGGAVGISSSTLGPSVLLAISTRTLVVSSSGNVGIGTPSPGRKLEVSGSGNTDTAIRLVETGNPQTWEFSVGLPGISNTQELTVRDVTSGNSRLVINTSGNVGVGSNSPSSFFDITGGSLTIKGTNAGLNVSTGGSTSIFDVNSSSVIVRTQGLTINRINYAWPSADGSANQVLTTNGSGALSWAASGGGVGSYIAITSMTSSGNVALATATSGVGVSSTTLGPDVQFTVSTRSLVVTYQGKVGIGNPLPDERFVVGQSTGSYFSVLDRGDTGLVEVLDDPVLRITQRNSVAAHISLVPAGGGDSRIVWVRSGRNMIIRNSAAASAFLFRDDTAGRNIIQIWPGVGDGYRVGFGNGSFGGGTAVVNLEHVGTDPLVYVSSTDSTWQSFVVAGSGSGYNVGIRKSAPVVALDLGTNAQFGLGISSTVRGNLVPGKAGATVFDNSINRVCVATATNANSWTFMDNTACQ